MGMAARFTRTTIRDVCNAINKLSEDSSTTKIDIGIIKTDITWLKESQAKSDARSWYILAGIVVTFLSSLVLAFV